MNISTLAKILGVGVSELRETGAKNSIYGFNGRNTRIPYNSAVQITKLLRPDRLSKLKNDDKIYLPASLTVAEFAETIGKPAGIVLKSLIMNGIIVTMNELVDYDTAVLIAEELGVETHPESEDLISGNIENSNDDLIKIIDYGDSRTAEYISRPPVITVMGHVDHGKTTLLDTIRNTNVVSGEAGAITQHIATYQISYKPVTEGAKNLNLVKSSDGGYLVTFVDTPGHEAFTAMRARGTQLADYIILMVSAVEGPKPQTVEVIERAKLSKTPVIVALNKIDLPDVDLERVKGEIAKYGLVPDEWGGDTPFIPISAKTGLGIDKLLETILVHSEMLELKGQINCPGQAVVIESHLDNQLGIVGTALVVKGEIATGDTVRIGTEVTRLRRLETTDSKAITKAGLSEPVIILGLSSIANIGENLIVYPTVKKAQNDASLEIIKRSQSKRITNTKSTATQSGEVVINLVLKADVNGSLEALKESILKIPQDKVKIVIKFEAVGAINEGDIDFAETSNSTILAFHTSVSSKLEQLIQIRKLTLIKSDIIYEILEWVEEQILANTKHETKEIILGEAKVLAIFKSEKNNQFVFGGEVISGKITDSKEVKIIRGQQIIGKYEIVELQRNKVKATEINISQQFGISIKGKQKIQVGDIMQSIDEILVK